MWLLPLPATATTSLAFPVPQASAKEPASACQPQILSIQAAQAGANPDQRPVTGWQEVALPDQWSKRWPGYGGTAWYRIRWQQPCHAAVGVTLDSLSQAGAFYLNEELIWSDPQFSEPLPRNWNLPHYWLLPASSLQPGENTLWFRVTGVHYQLAGLGRLSLGDPSTQHALQQDQILLQRTWLQADIALSFTLSVLSLLVWMSYRRATVFGWFALLTGSWVAFASCLLLTSPWPWPDTASLERFTVSALVFYCACFALFSWSFAEMHWPRARRAVLVTAALLILLPWLTPERWLGYSTLFAFVLSSSLILLNCLLLQWPLWRRRPLVLPQVLLALWLLSVLVIGLHDLTVVLFFPHERNVLTPYSGIATLLCMGMLMALRVARDMRRIRRFNQELKQSVEEARQDLLEVSERQLAMERERSRLQARMDLTHDLHDGLGSSLVRAIGSVEHAMGPMSNQAFLGYLKVLRDDLRQILDTEASSTSKPAATPAQWLAPVRHRFGMLFDEIGMDVSWQIPASWPIRPQARLCLALSRVLEEALTNIVKHSQASQVQVALQRLDDPAGMQLCVTDNGRGFDVAAMEQAGTGVGLQSMRARIERLGGQWQISSDSHGTRICLLLPGDPPA